MNDFFKTKQSDSSPNKKEKGKQVGFAQEEPSISVGAIDQNSLLKTQSKRTSMMGMVESKSQQTLKPMETANA